VEPTASSVIAIFPVVLLMLLVFILVRSTFDDILPGVPELKGVPILGPIYIYLKHGMPQLLNKLIEIGDDGISYVNIFNNILVSVHDPVMVRAILTYPEEIASR
jgi:hypothetical protein